MNVNEHEYQAWVLNDFFSPVPFPGGMIAQHKSFKKENTLVHKFEFIPA